MKKCYEDILDLPHHISAAHPPMPKENRAAQFSPFSALSGYEEAVVEEGRLTNKKADLSEDERERLDVMLRRIMERDEESREAVFTRFRPDSQKEGGACVSLKGRIKRIDYCKKAIILDDGTRILMEEIMDIQTV